MSTAKPTSAPLWAKDLPLDAAIHRFTVGRDPELDLALYGFDCIASAAHVRMLAATQLIELSDSTALLAALKAQYALSVRSAVQIEDSQEDCHTALESALVAATGEAGKRIHLARSRNDQVLIALRLYLRAQLTELGFNVLTLARVLAQFADDFKSAAMPGYTHMRKAMPSSFGLWAVGYAEALVEELDASIGVHARQWVTWHGFALNVTTDLSYFDLMVPCGIADVTMTSVDRELLEQRSSMCLVSNPALGDDVRESVVRSFGEVFERQPVRTTLAAIEPALLESP